MSSIGALRHYLGFTGAGIVGLIGLELFLWRIASLGRAGGLELFKTVYIQLLFYPKLLLEYARAMLPRTKIAWTTSGENHTRSLRDTTLHIIIGLAFLFAGIGLRSPLLVLIGAVSATSFLTEYCSGARFTAFLVNAAGAGMAFVLLRFCYLTVGTCFFL